MAVMTKAKADLAKDVRVKKEKNKLARIYKNIPEDQRKLVSQLIENSAFIAVLLEDLRNDIDKNGWTETYNHGGGQSGNKRSVAADLYMVAVKNYSQITKQLNDLLPDGGDQEDDLMTFLKNHPRNKNKKV